MRDLRRGVREVLERRKVGEKAAGHEFEIAVTHVVHKIYVSDVTEYGCY